MKREELEYNVYKLLNLTVSFTCCLFIDTSHKSNSGGHASRLSELIIYDNVRHHTQI